MLGDKYGRQKILAITIVIMSMRHLLYRSYSLVCLNWYLGADSAAAV
jgi:hypothetical protein